MPRDAAVDPRGHLPGRDPENDGAVRVAPSVETDVPTEVGGRTVASSPRASPPNPDHSSYGAHEALQRGRR